VTAKPTRRRNTAEYKLGILRGDIDIIDDSRNKLYKWQKQVVRTGAGAEARGKKTKKRESKLFGLCFTCARKPINGRLYRDDCLEKISVRW